MPVTAPGLPVHAGPVPCPPGNTSPCSWTCSARAPRNLHSPPSRWLPPASLLPCLLKQEALSSPLLQTGRKSYPAHSGQCCSNKNLFPLGSPCKELDSPSCLLGCDLCFAKLLATHLGLFSLKRRSNRERNPSFKDRHLQSSPQASLPTSFFLLTQKSHPLPPNQCHTSLSQGLFLLR